jgi:chromosome segregation ATPase
MFLIIFILQNTRVEQLEKDHKQLISQLNTKDSIIEQLTQEKANARSVSDEVEALQKTLQDKENRCEALEIELSNLRHKLTNSEQQLSENIEKLSEAERVSCEAQTNVESMTKEIQQLTNERNELTQEVEKISSSLKIKEAEVLALSEQVSSNSSVIEKLNLERDDLSKELQNIQSENSKLTKRIKDLTQKVEGLTSDNRDSIAQLNELREKFVEISNDKLRLAEEVDKEKSKVARLEQELFNKSQEVKIAEEEKKITTATKTANGTTHEENPNYWQLTSKPDSSQEELKQLLFKERQKTLNLELQLKRMLEVSPPLASSNLNLSPPNSASRRYSFSQFSGVFEIGKCSGCIGEVIIV